MHITLNERSSYLITFWTTFGQYKCYAYNMDDTVVYGCGQIIESAILKELNLTKDKLRLCQTDVKYMGNIPPMASVLIWTSDSHYRYEKI